MNRRFWMMTVVAGLSVVLGTHASGAKPVLVETSPIELPGIDAVGDVDLVSPGGDGTAVLKVFLSRKGAVTVEIEATGIVPNLSGKKFKTKNAAELNIPTTDPLGPGTFIEKFEYSVSKSGKASLKATIGGDIVL